MVSLQQVSGDCSVHETKDPTLSRVYNLYQIQNIIKCSFVCDFTIRIFTHNTPTFVETVPQFLASLEKKGKLYMKNEKSKERHH